MKTFTGKVALVTGASSGIGAAVAVELAQRGCSLCLAGRNEVQLSFTKVKCLEAGLTDDQVILNVGDVRDNAYLESLVAHNIEHFGRLNILVNNAGIFAGGGLTSSSLGAFDTMLNVNLRSVMQLTQLCIPYLKESRGTIVNVSSIYGQEPSATSTYYNISKAGINMLTKCLALELASSRVRVNAVQPGIILDTNILRDFTKDELDRLQASDNPEGAYALGRYGKPTEVAKAVVFLAGDDASFTTGHLLDIDGGHSIMPPH